MSGLPDPQLAVAIAQMQGLAEDMSEVKVTMRQLAAAVTKLAVVEERQVADRAALERAFKELEKHDGRLDTLEQSQPLQKQSSEWVTRAVGWFIAAMAGVLVSTAISRPELKMGLEARRYAEPQRVEP